MSEEKTNISVSAFILRDGKFLLLKRCNKPRRWGPPAGRVLKGEHFLNAVKREAREEANIDIKIIMPFGVWAGYHDDEYLYAVNFLCEYISGEVKVSEEHDDFLWLAVNEINKLELINSIEDFVKAKNLRDCLSY